MRRTQIVCLLQHFFKKLFEAFRVMSSAFCVERAMHKLTPV